MTDERKKKRKKRRRVERGPRPADPDPKLLRRDIVSALFGNDELYRRLVLKGGTALDNAHGVVSRSSMDVDFSIADDFDDQARAGALIVDSLKTFFAQRGLEIIDYEFTFQPEKRAKESVEPFWGGYRASFKFVHSSDAKDLDLAEQQRTAVPIDARHNRTMKVDVSRREFCDEKIEVNVGEHTWVVYTLELLVAEKLRAICQQMPSYSEAMHTHRKERARDFFDICNVVDRFSIDCETPEFAEIVKLCFEAKRVQLELLREIGSDETRDFHSPNWEAVLQTAHVKPEAFEHYVARVAGFAASVLKVLGYK